MKLKTHLVFPGTCEEALNFYKDVLKGELIFLFRKKEDKTNIALAEEDKEKISHMIIKTPLFELTGEDANHDKKVVMGNSNKLILMFYDLEECKHVFEIFSQNGTVTMPLQKIFFSEAMGEITDKFGIPWIIMMTDEDYSA